MEANKVLVELEWEQIDAIIKTELRDQIEMIHREMTIGHYIHPEDKLDNETLLPALFRVYQYWAGEAESMRLMDELGIGHETGTD